MKSSDIVTVNIAHEAPILATGSQMNPTAAVIYIHKMINDDTMPSSDVTWLSIADIKALEKNGYLGDDTVGRVISSYQSNGGYNLLIKRLYFPKSTSDADDYTNGVKNAVQGLSGHTGLPEDVINIQLAWNEESSGANPSVSAIAKLFESGGDTFLPYEDAKIIFVSANSLPANMIINKNIFYHYNPVASGVYVNQFESAAAMAYLSKINYRNDIIKDYEYTNWLGNINNVNIVDEKPSMTNGHVNFFTNLIGRTVLIGGVMTNGTRLLTHYFTIVIGQRVTSNLIALTLDKINFVDTTYSTIYNVITIELDIFAKNGLLDQTFIAKEDKFEFRDDERYVLLEKDEQLLYGYKVNVLPPTQHDLANRLYTGTYIHLAINNQIRTLGITGLVLGGVK